MKLPRTPALLLALASCAQRSAPTAPTAPAPAPVATAAPAPEPATPIGPIEPIEPIEPDEPKESPAKPTPPEPVVSSEPVAPDRVKIRGGQSRGKRVATFMLDRSEVTVEAYARCVAAKACDPASTRPGDDWHWQKAGRERYPMNGVSATSAQIYCEWVGARLPTEREWAWAARGGPANLAYPWGNDPPTCAHAVMADCGPRHAAEVGSRPDGRSRDGILDLAGNVAEWAENSASGFTEVWAVVVGGSYADPAKSLGVHHRQSNLPPHFTVSTTIGFRCAAKPAK